MSRSLTAISIALLMVGVGCGSAAKPGPAPAATHWPATSVSADSFFAVAEGNAGAIEQFSASPGKAVRRVAPARHYGLVVSLRTR